MKKTYCSREGVYFQEIFDFLKNKGIYIKKEALKNILNELITKQKIQYTLPNHPNKMGGLDPHYTSINAYK